MKRLFTALLFVSLLASTNVNAQKFDDVVAQLTDVAAKSYLKPISNGIGSNLNSGWMSRVPESTTFSFHFDIKAVVMGTFFGDDQKNFTANGQFYFDQTQIQQILANSGITSSTTGYSQIYNEMVNTKFDVAFAGPTIIGKDNEYLKVTFPGKTIQGKNIGKYDVTIKEVWGYLKDMPVFPLVAPQITVGTVFGTNLSFRYASLKNIQDVGDLSWFGIGGIHNPGVWFPNPLPVDIGIGYYQQNIKLGNIIENNSSLFGVYVGKTFGGAFAFIPYAGLTVENSKTTIKYTADQTVSGVDVKVPINFDLEGENTTGVMVGFTLKLGLVNINADYKVAKVKTASAGVSLGW